MILAWLDFFFYILLLIYCPIFAADRLFSALWRKIILDLWQMSSAYSGSHTQNIS